eukprot:TRINITY_DN2421_c0_g1_i6.p1 TRINITY_DN2421_c0_g1~~TRINITY_DN2421_c0_g1_i6.p1  ORF type:complete len:379 (+),score=93.94 TRINITY_DN2421_c0_g1_i6:100-1236(+)
MPSLVGSEMCIRDRSSTDKRPLENEPDRNTLESTNFQPPLTNTSSMDAANGGQPESSSERMILKVLGPKTDNPTKPEQSSTNGTHGTTTDKSAPPEKKGGLFSSFLNTTIPNTTESKPLFSGLFGNRPERVQSKEKESDDDEDEKEEDSREKSPKKHESNHKSPFANLLSMNTAAAPASSGGSGLFSSLLGGGSNTTTGGSGFYSNLLGSGTTFSSLVNSNPGTFFKKNTDEDDEDDDGEGPDEQVASPEPDPSTLVVTAEIKSDFDVLINKKVEKFKVDNNNLLGQGSISFEKLKEGDMYMLVFRNPAKRILYQGVLLPKISKSTYLNERKEAISIVCVTKQDPEAKPKKEIAKIMFLKTEECGEFKEKLDSILGAN